ncbi:hypothetical protein TWF694_011833 [Orbilia ellipsospora]|uniref:Uncharacterized protein n=1 Tax=Orbilia ellipsospora TaxID=2528407 RepID=A0AAV9X913_9PEZI
MLHSPLKMLIRAQINNLHQPVLCPGKAMKQRTTAEEDDAPTLRLRFLFAFSNGARTPFEPYNPAALSKRRRKKKQKTRKNKNMEVKSKRWPAEDPVLAAVSSRTGLIQEAPARSVLVKKQNLGTTQV